MTSDEHYPVGTPVPRSDSFEILEPAGPELTDEEKTWPVVALQPRSDSFEVIGQTSKADELEVVIRVRCAATATPAEVRAFVEQLRTAVESVRPSAASTFPVQITLPATTS